MECASWVCEDFLWEHEWFTETNVLSKENDILEALNYDIGRTLPTPVGTSVVLCTVKAQSQVREQWHESSNTSEKQSTWRLRSHLTCLLTEFTLHERAYCVQ